MNAPSPTVISTSADAIAPAVTAVPDPADTTGMTVLVTVDNHGNGLVILTWGQTNPTLPSSVNPGDGVAQTKKKYTVAGTWTITATSLNVQLPPGTAQVTVPNTGPKPVPVVTAVENPRVPTGMGIVVTVDNHGDGPVTVDWGEDGAAPATNNGDNTDASYHSYKTPGDYTITATSVAHPDNPPGTTQVTMPMQPAPDIEVHENPGVATGMGVIVTIDNHGYGPVVVTFSESGLQRTVVNPGDGTTPIKHTYTKPGTWSIIAADQVNPNTTPQGRGSATVPMRPAPRIDVQTDPDVHSGMGVIATVASYGAGPVTLDWGQTPALPTSNNPGDGVTATKQTYTKSGKWAVTATDAADAWAPTGTVEWTAPYTEAEDAPAVHFAEDTNVLTGMGVVVWVDNHGNGPTTLDWGYPSLPPTQNRGDQVDNSRGLYPQPGTYIIAATSNADPDGPEGFAQVTVPMQPAPDVDVQPDPDVPGGMGVIVTTDSHGYGQVWLLWGDDPDSDGDLNAGDGVTPTKHTYTKTGAMTIMAANPAKPAFTPWREVPITVPFVVAPAAPRAARKSGADRRRDRR